MNSDNDEMDQPVIRRSNRSNKGIPPQRYENVRVAQSQDFHEPKTLKEAMNSPNWCQWKIAMQEELDSLNKNNTWDLVEYPKGQNVFGCKWTYKIKRGVDVDVLRYKARLEAK